MGTGVAEGMWLGSGAGETVGTDVAAGLSALPGSLLHLAAHEGLSAPAALGHRGDRRRQHRDHQKHRK